MTDVDRRIDHNFSSADKVFVRYAGDRSNWDQQDINPNFPYSTKSIATNIAFQHIHIFGGRTLNEFRYGLNKADDDTFNPRSNTDFDLDSLGVGQFRVAVDKNRKLTPREMGLPSTIIGHRDGGNGYDFNTVHQFANNFSVGRGSHNFKTGMEYRRVILDRAAANLPRGSFGCCPGGYSLAGWLLGYIDSRAMSRAGPIYKNWRLPLGEGTRLQFRSEFFNAFNTPQFGLPNGIGFATLNSIIPDAPRMGEIRNLRLPMRVIQFGLKLYF